MEVCDGLANHNVQVAEPGMRGEVWGHMVWFVKVTQPLFSVFPTKPFHLTFTAEVMNHLCTLNSLRWAMTAWKVVLWTVGIMESLEPRAGGSWCNRQTCCFQRVGSEDGEGASGKGSQLPQQSSRSSWRSSMSWGMLSPGFTSAW